MAFDPSSAALLEAPQFDASSAEPVGFDSSTAEPHQWGAAEIQQAEEQQKMEQDYRAPKWANDAAEAALNTASGLIPRSVSDVAHFLTPILSSGEELKKAYAIGKDMLDGATVEEATRKHAPESFELADAGKTPALSKERFQAGFNTIAQMLMAAGLVKGHLKAGEVPKVEAQTATDRAGSSSNIPSEPASVQLPFDAAPVEPLTVNTDLPSRPEVSGIPQSEITTPIVEPSTAEIQGNPEPQPASSATGPMERKWDSMTPEQRFDVIAPFYPFDAVSGSPLLRRIARSNVSELKPGEWDRVQSHLTTTEYAPSVPDATEANPAPVSPESTSTKNAVTNEERIAREIAPAVEAAKRDFGTVWDEAANADPMAPQRLVESITENPRALTDTENALLLRRQIEVQNEHDAAVNAVNEAPDASTRQEAQARLDRVRDDLQTVYDAAKVAGTETGRGLAARKMLANNDFSLAKMEATTRAVANNGKALSSGQLAEVKALHERISKAELKLSAYEAREAFERELKIAKAEARKTGTFKVQSFLDQQAQRARERIISRRGRLHADPIGVTQIAHLADEAIIGASHLARGVTKFGDWSKQMVSEFGDRIRPFLNALFAKAQELHSESLKRATLTPEDRLARGLAGDKKAIQTRIGQLQEKTAAGDFAKPEKPAPRMDKEKAALLFEYQKAKEAYNRGLFEARLKQQSVPRKVLRMGGETINTARALMTSFDMSAVLRQGGFIAFAHPVRALKSFPDMFRAFGSEKAQHRINAEIMTRPNAPTYLKAKLFLVDESATSLSKMEEAYMSRWASKIPGVAASQRAYITFLNKLRADSFDAMAEGLAKRGVVTPDEARAIANYINVATGRGDMGAAAQAAVGLNTFFFAPRLVLSRFQLLAGQPMYRGSYRTRMLVANEYARFLAGAGIVYALGASAGATIDTHDSTSPDFLKIKFGDTRVDPLSGLIQTTVFSSRELEAVKRFVAQSKEKNPKYGSGGEVLARFLRTKLSPAVGGIVDVLSGKNVVGQSVTPKSVAGSLVVPMSIGDVYQAMKEQGVPKGAALGLLSIFGAGLQTYHAKH